MGVPEGFSIKEILSSGRISEYFIVISYSSFSKIFEFILNLYVK